MGTPLGDFVRAKRDATSPGALGLPDTGRRRAPGLRRSELAARAGVSVEYLTRIEQGRDRNPSPAIVNALADALALDVNERDHLYYAAKITDGSCCTVERPAPPTRTVRPEVAETLRLLEPGVAAVTNRLGDVLDWTTGFASLMAPSGLLAGEPPNLTWYVFTDRRARTFFPDWGQVADEQASDVWKGPSASSSEWFRARLAPVAGPEFTRRVARHVPPPVLPLRVNHPDAGQLCWNRERLSLSRADRQEIVVYLPADDATAHAWQQFRQRSRGGLRVVAARTAAGSGA